MCWRSSNKLEWRRFRAHALRWLWLTLGLLPGCGLQFPPGQPASMIVPVFILRTEHLIRPAVGLDEAFIPEQLLPIDDASPSAGQAAGFFLTVAAANAQELKMRLVNRTSNEVTALAMIAPPATAEQTAWGDLPRAFDAAGKDLLRSGTAIFWLPDEPLDSGGLQHRLAVVIPESRLVPFLRLEVYLSQLPDGSPLGADRVELVKGFYYMAVIGDSILWGNGLQNHDKISTLVANDIEQTTQKRVIRQVYAVSGARIVPADGDSVCRFNCNGEALTALPSVTLQADEIRRPDLMDLVLMDGCINDIGVNTIVNPDTSAEDLIEQTTRYCGDEMTSLLRKVRSLAPQARTVVTGYYQIVSLESDFNSLQQFVQSQGVQEEVDLAAQVAAVSANAATFREQSRESLQAAVSTVNAERIDLAAIVLADPAFGPANAVLGPDAWLWGFTRDNALSDAVQSDLTLAPEDPLLDFRISACFDDGVIPDPVSCIYASVGHPNPKGARAYADAVMNALGRLDAPAAPASLP